MNKINPKRLRNIGKIIGVFVLAFLSIFLLSDVFAALLDNDVEVKPNSDLIYYLDVSYDGVDKNGVSSSDTVKANIKSGVMYIEDKIPDGLKFNGFVTTEDGTIGAVKRDTGEMCLGNVIDDTDGTETLNSYHGLHYDEATRTVTFRVKNLQAGCKLTVGIKTITPSTVDDPDTADVETRIDFYNFATIKESALTKVSNTVHVFMGDEFLPTYNVSYVFTGDVPSEVPTIPTILNYVEGMSVGVAPNINIEGYTFSGWTTSDVTISNGSFKMPAKNVVLSGSFTKIIPNKVTYSLNGITPPSYVLPSDKEYYTGSMVSIDSLKEGDVFNGYRFLGWKSSEVTISKDGDFEMPDSDVALVGEFEEVTYKVIYKFYDTVLPPNSDTYLPTEKEYKPGDTVTLDIVTEPSGYKFLGWYKENTFTMPNEDVTVYGEWKVQKGTFEPTITKEVVGEKTYYRSGDTITFKITIKNNATFAIKDITVRENTEGVNFKTGTNYTLLTDRIASITSIPAGGKIELYSTYKVKSTDSVSINNKVELLGAAADNNYEIADKEYIATATVPLQSRIKICKKIDGVSVDNTFQFEINNTNYNTWINLNKDECKTLYVDPGTYEIREIIPQEYEIKTVTGLTIDEFGIGTLNVNAGSDYEVTFTNTFKKKGFLHSTGRIVNKVAGVMTGE